MTARPLALREAVDRDGGADPWALRGEEADREPDEVIATRPPTVPAASTTHTNVFLRTTLPLLPARATPSPKPNRHSTSSTPDLLLWGPAPLPVCLQAWVLRW